VAVHLAEELGVLSPLRVNVLRDAHAEVGQHLQVPGACIVEPLVVTGGQQVLEPRHDRLAELGWHAVHQHLVSLGLVLIQPEGHPLSGHLRSVSKRTDKPVAVRRVYDPRSHKGRLRDAHWEPRHSAARAGR
jgi:hypothetical protein